MSRTFHTVPFHCLKRQKVQNRRKRGQDVLEQLQEENIISRHFNRVKAYWSNIADPCDDRMVSSGREFRSKQWWQKWWAEVNNPHFTKNATV